MRSAPGYPLELDMARPDSQLDSRLAGSAPPEGGAGALAMQPAAAARPNAFKRLYQWVLHWAETPYGTPALAGISFAESSFFPIPPDVLQIALSVGRPKRSFFYAAVSAAASVLGGIVGWAIGTFLWHAVDDVMFAIPGFTHEAFDHVQHLYVGNAFLAIVTAAFTPIPFKVFTIASGVFGVPLPLLVVASALGRSGRFFLVAGTIYVFGPAVRSFLDRYLEWVTLGLFVLLIAGFYAARYLF
jgi:membrane protein YqaA with SNARE-associated domain